MVGRQVESEQECVSAWPSFLSPLFFFPHGNLTSASHLGEQASTSLELHPPMVQFWNKSQSASKNRHLICRVLRSVLLPVPDRNPEWRAAFLSGMAGQAGRAGQGLCGLCGFSSKKKNPPSLDNKRNMQSSLC